MKKILFSLMAVAAALVGCTREIEPEGSTVVPVSKYLVINADCAPMTKTDINEGKSTWTAGDKITVLYNGEAYEYVAGTPSEDGKQTYFTSTAGITDYDGTGLVAYYEALSAEDGTVGIAAERDIEFFDLAQKNPACAPLVGYTNAETLDNGVINMHFENIFSVIELRIDPAGSQMTSPMKTLKIEPAEGSEFEGYITCSGVVDASTLALETLQTGNVLTLNFPDQADARVAQVIKFPVGRFTSSKGLKVTLTLEDGSELVKNIYKSGITTFSESDGRYSVQHLAKAMYAFSGGIGCAQDLVDFAAAVNNGSSLIEYMNDEGKIVLLDDIDMTGVTNWTPIGNGKFHGSVTATDNHTSHYSGPAFKGYFDGRGKSILNLKMSAEITADNNVYGLFGILDGATVENLTVGAAEGDASELTFSAADSLDVGVVAGAMMSSTIRNCVNYVPMNVTGSTAAQRVTMAGFAGFVYANQGAGCTLENLVNYGSIKAAGGSNTTNGAASVMAAGIAGLANGTTTISTTRNHISNCVNYGNIESSVARSCGIVSAANQYTIVENCKNYGDQVNTGTDVRIGMITAIMANYTALKDCENHGDLVLTKNNVNKVQGGGLVCMMNSTTAEITGGGNYGMIIGDILTSSESTVHYLGLIAANFSKLSKVDGVVVDGSIGSYNGGNYKMVTLSTSNYRNYIGIRSDANDAKITNLVFNGPDAPGIRTADDLMELASLVNAGSDYSKFCQNGVVVLLNDIDMTGKTWTPIGNAKVSNYAPTGGKAFTGKFNGMGHSIRNIKLTPTYSSAVDGTTYGLFGFLNGATVENLVMGAPSGDSSELTFKGNGVIDAGVVAGFCRKSTIRNCVNYVPMICNGNAVNEKRTTMAAFAGYVISMSGESTTLADLVNYGDMTAKRGANTNNGGNGVIVGGIIGHAYTHNDATGNTVSNCINYGDMTSEVSRTAGIAGSVQRKTTLSSCKNYGNQTNTGTNIRAGMITCFMSDYCYMRDCENHGDLVLTQSGSNAQGGGLVCLISGSTDVDASSEITGGGNYGMIVGDILNETSATSRYLGQIAANFSKFAKVDNVVVGGTIGTYNGGNYQMVSLNNDNYMDYIGIYAAANASKITNIIFDGADAINILFIGNSFTDDSVKHLPGMLAAAGIKNVNMVHMYYGGRLMSAYNSTWATAKDYSAYTCNAGATGWTTVTGKSLKDICESRQWDVVTIQEHTGNAAAWVWNDTAKSNVTGVINHIKESQGDAKIYYIMSQAYYNMDRIGFGSRSAITWPVAFYNTDSSVSLTAAQHTEKFAAKNKATAKAEQLAMYPVITAFAQEVMAECDVDGIIPTGTMLQNLRTTSCTTTALDLTRDGYHMDLGLARYGASCTVFETVITPLTGVKLDGNTYRFPDNATGTTPVTDANAPIALQAARNAIAKPFEITDMSQY